MNVYFLLSIGQLKDVNRKIYGFKQKLWLQNIGLNENINLKKYASVYSLHFKEDINRIKTLDKVVLREKARCALCMKYYNILHLVVIKYAFLLTILRIFILDRMCEKHTINTRNLKCFTIEAGSSLL